MFSNTIHEFFKLSKKANWHNFEGSGLYEPYFQYYYAENGLYVIKDVMLNSYWFVEASDPKNAIEKYHEMCYEVSSWGDYVKEEEELWK